MIDWERHVARVGEARILAAVGAFLLATVAVRLSIWEGIDAVSALVARNLLLIIPGVFLLSAAYDLRDSTLHPDARPRIAGRCLGGIAALLAVVLVLALGGVVSQSQYTPILAVSIGSVAGYGIGIQEARAYSAAYEAEEARREAERHRDEYRAERDLRERIVQTSPIGISIVDADGSIRLVNEHAARIIGVPKERLESLDDYNAPMFEATDSDGEEVGEWMFEAVMNGHEPVYDVERQVTRADGDRRWLSVNAAPLLVEDGEVDSIVFAFKDVTDRKVDQRRLEESNSRLEQFAHAASHDLQEPLRMVSTYLQLIESRYRDELDEDGREFIDFAVDGADRMRAMIDGLLEYSRIETQGEAFESVDLNPVVTDARENLRMAIEGSNGTVEVDSLPTVDGDRDQLRQVFENLLANGIDYSGEAAPAIEITADQGDGEWTISVCDAGIGIDAADPDRIFEVFQRLHSRGEHAGTGIGLAICERIVERHGGQIWVADTGEDGTTISFTVPTTHGHSTDPFSQVKTSDAGSSDPVAQFHGDTGAGDCEAIDSKAMDAAPSDPEAADAEAADAEAADPEPRNSKPGRGDPVDGPSHSGPGGDGE